MSLIEAICLAIIQGLTEFLPVSSSAHLILLPILMSWQDQGLAFDVAVHVGTLLAVMVFLKKELMRMIPAWFSGWRSQQWNTDGQLAWWVIVATIPVGLAGLLFNDFIEHSLRSMTVIAFSTAFFALCLAWSDKKASQNTKQLDDIRFLSALWVGLAQALALIPGTSRSGVTMTALLSLGFNRKSAAKFSFLLAIPTILLGGGFKFLQLVKEPNDVYWLALFVGVIVSALTAFFCMHGFMRLIERVGMMPFVVYRLLLAAVILWFAGSL